MFKASVTTNVNEKVAGVVLALSVRLRVKGNVPASGAVPVTVREAPVPLTISQGSPEVMASA